MANKYKLKNVTDEIAGIEIKKIGEALKGISRPYIVLLGDGRRAFMKNSEEIDGSDDLEIVINYIGKSIGINMAEEYRIIDESGNKVALLSIAVTQSDMEVFVEMRNVQNDIVEKLKDGTLSMEMWMQKWLEITKYLAFPKLEDNCEYCCKSRNDCLEALDFGINLARMIPECRKKSLIEFRRNYLKMILFDIFIGQTDRTLNNYGVIISKDGPSVHLAPLFDNATLEKPYLKDGLYCLNGMILDREMLCKELFKMYRDEINESAQAILDFYEKSNNIIMQLIDEWSQNHTNALLKRKLNEGYHLILKYI